MIRLISYWKVHWVDEDRVNREAGFQTWLDETTGKKEYWLFKPPKNQKEIVTQQKGNRYYYYLRKRYNVRVVKLI